MTRSNQSDQDAVIVTGASTGIGFDVCRLLCANGYQVFGTVRREADGVSLERIPEMRRTYGKDVIFIVGGDLHRHGPDLAENCREFSESEIENLKSHLSKNMESLCTACGYCIGVCPQEEEGGVGPGVYGATADARRAVNRSPNAKSPRTHANTTSRQSTAMLPRRNQLRGRLR